MGTGLSNGSVGLERASLREIAPSCDALVSFMLTHGLNVDVPTELIMHALNVTLSGGGGMGAYSGRVNKNEGRKGSKLRLVPGVTAKSYRLIQLA